MCVYAVESFKYELGSQTQTQGLAWVSLFLWLA